MYALVNDQLVVSILDPVADKERLGARYCTGGYIYQVEDRVLGPLVSGPGYPSEFYPPVFDGQGLPEAFMNPLGPDGLQMNDETALTLGVGLVLPRSQVVQEACAWEVQKKANSLSMTTTHVWKGWGAEVKREVTLWHRTIRSATTVRNMGEREIPLRWFPHPFYPPVVTGECCKFSFPVSFPDNPGYVLREDGWIVRKLDHIWERRGHFQLMEFEGSPKMSELSGRPFPEIIAAFSHPHASGELRILQRHPKLGLVAAVCDFGPVFLPIWGNCNTFSFEPYYGHTLPVGEETTWSITYEF